jgi:hypothetical protein
VILPAILSESIPRRPRLSWKLRSRDVDQRQIAWQVLVASSSESLDRDVGDVWDSGRCEGGDQLHVPFGGRTLHSSERVFWKVRVWDGADRASAWSEPATWTMGVLSAGDWHAHWITDAESLRWVRKKIGYRSTDATDDREEKWLALDLGEPRSITRVRPLSIAADGRGVTGDAAAFPHRGCGQPRISRSHRHCRLHCKGFCVFHNDAGEHRADLRRAFRRRDWTLCPRHHVAASTGWGSKLPCVESDRGHSGRAKCCSAGTRFCEGQCRIRSLERLRGRGRAGCARRQSPRQCHAAPPA